MTSENLENNVVLSGRPHKATHHDITVTAWRLFEEVGFEAATMAQIAERCQMSRRSLFNYFPNKYALLFPGTAESLEEFEAQLHARPANEKMFDALIACVDASNAKMQQAAEIYVAGPQVAAARQTEGAVNYNRDLWAFELEQIVLERVGESQAGKIQAALIGVVTAQAITEMFKLLRLPGNKLTEQQALKVVLDQIPAVFAG